MIKKIIFMSFYINFNENEILKKEKGNGV